MEPCRRDLRSGRWLTEERQERLADTVTTLAKEHDWAAGCVFRWTADEAVVDEFTRPEGTAAYSFVNDPELRPAVVVYVEGVLCLRGGRVSGGHPGTEGQLHRQVRGGAGGCDGGLPVVAPFGPGVSRAVSRLSAPSNAAQPHPTRDPC